MLLEDGQDETAALSSVFEAANKWAEENPPPGKLLGPEDVCELALAIGNPGLIRLLPPVHVHKINPFWWAPFMRE